VWLLNVFDLARPTPPDLLVLLRVPVARAMEKIRAAGEPIEPYQNEAFLERLGLAYEQVAALLARRGRTEVVAFQVGADEPERIGEEVATACARKIVELARRGTSP
jgi:thymidylate kinase